jgi:O-antigen ligase
MKYPFDTRESPDSLGAYESQENIWSSAALLVGCLLLISAPVIRGGNRQVALIALEWLGLSLGLLLLVARLFSPSSYGAKDKHRDGLLLLVLMSPLAFALLQLTPIPVVWWAALPGHSINAAAVAAVEPGAVAYRTISLNPDATCSSLFASIPIVATFLLSSVCSDRQLVILVRTFILVALVQAVIGLLQLSSMFNWLQFGAEGRPKGTFGNSNHYANFLAMAIPLTWLKFLDLLSSDSRRERRGGARTLWGVAMFVLLAGVVASSSRTGIATAFLVTFGATAFIKGRNSAPGQLRSYIICVAMLLIVTLAVVAPDIWTARFSGKTGNDAGIRWQIYANTWQAALDFFPFGSGMGSYGAVFPRYQPSNRDEFFEYAHNDYLQFLLEGGLLATSLMGTVIWKISVGLINLVHEEKRAEATTDTNRLKIAMALSLAALLLHSTVDFNLHIPANAIIGALSVAVILRHSGDRGRAIRGMRRQRLKSEWRRTHRQGKL